MGFLDLDSCIHLGAVSARNVTAGRSLLGFLKACSLDAKVVHGLCLKRNMTIPHSWSCVGHWDWYVKDVFRCFGWSCRQKTQNEVERTKIADSSVSRLRMRFSNGVV